MDLPYESIRLWPSQTEDHQIVVFGIDPVSGFPAHSQGAQCDIVAKGEMDLTIGDKTRTYKKGDSYFIPGGVMHSATFRQKTFVIDYFDDKHRYPVK